MATLWEAAKARWTISLKCERTREGLKSVRACMTPIALHLPTLIAALGPDVKVDELPARIVCPRCGSRRFALRTIVPPDVSSATDQPTPRQMKPAQRVETLGSTPEEWIVVKCSQCNRRGEYRKQTLLAVFPAETPMPDLLPSIAAWRGCGPAQKHLEMDARWRATQPRACDITYDVDTRAA